MSKFSTSLALAGLLSLAAVAAAHAQAGGGAGVIPRPPANAMPSHYDPSTGLDATQTRLYREQKAEEARQRKIAEAKVRKETPPERLARAEKVAALLNDGKCADAAKLALDEGDQELANKVGQICRKTARR